MYHIKQELILEVQQVPALLQILHFLSLAHKFLHVLPLQDHKKGPAPHGLTLMLFEDSRNRVSVEAKGHSLNICIKVCGHLWLIAHLFEWPMARFKVKKIRFIMQLDYVLKIDTIIPGSIVTAHVGGVMSSLKRNIRTATLTYKFCLSTLFLRLQMTICVICSGEPDESIPDSIQQSNLSVEFVVPQSEWQ